MSDSDYTLTLMLSEKRGSGRYVMAIDLPRDVAGEFRRAVDDMKAGAALGIPLMSFDQAITLMKQREFRRERFIREAQRLGAKLADFMEDNEGWHGVDRQEITDEILKELSK